MAYYWARWLKPALESDPFVKARLIEVPGWETRGRPPSDFNFLPTGILDHHTACMARVGHDPQVCINYDLAGRPPEAPGPISQLLGTWTPPGVKWNGSNPDPRIVLLAAGRANHAGAGAYPWGAPPGNGSSIGIEWCGPSQTSAWPDIVVELRERVDAAILKHNGWSIQQLTTHAEYAPTRKIDQSGAWYAEPDIDWNRRWNAQLWRQRVAARMGSTPTPPQETEMTTLEESVRVLDTRTTNSAFAAGETRKVPVILSSTARAVSLCVTVLPLSSEKGFLQAWKPGKDKPQTGFVTWQNGDWETNSFDVAVEGGHVMICTSKPCHLVIDLMGHEG